jgi:hypothetical protein
LKALCFPNSLRQAVLLAVVFEFTGAIVLGRVSAETIAGGIAKQETFQLNPPAFAFGMSVVLWLGFIVQMIASYMGLNVSATHCIIVSSPPCFDAYIRNTKTRTHTYLQGITDPEQENNRKICHAWCKNKPHAELMQRIRSPLTDKYDMHRAASSGSQWPGEDQNLCSGPNQIRQKFLLLKASCLSSYLGSYPPF